MYKFVIFMRNFILKYIKALNITDENRQGFNAVTCTFS